MKSMSLCACFVLFLLTFTHVHGGRDCSDMKSILNCNECKRCGGFWCNNPLAGPRCSIDKNSYCPHHEEEVEMDAFREPIKGNVINPVFIETKVIVGATKTVQVVYKSTVEQKANLAIVNSTQSYNITLDSKTTCSGDECVVSIDMRPKHEFCLTSGTITESVHVKLSIDGINEDVFIKYRVPCACSCSQNAEKVSSKCNYNGDYTCGVCDCHSGWSGKSCEIKEKCHRNRGDIQCTNPILNTGECSGNGKCGPCETCECFTDRPGSQYFDKNNYCADLCMTVNDYDSCLIKPNIGSICNDFSVPMHIREFNDTLLQDRDEQNRAVWVKCNETLPDECYVEYAAMMKDEDIVVMIISYCHATPAPAIVGSVVKVTIPVILGVIGIVAVVSAVAGYMVYKNRSPPLPLTDPQYQNIGAEDCTGENPLYKPPTSSFKNPTYGKW